MDRKDGNQGNGQDEPVEWEDEELVTASQYFSDDELQAIEDSSEEEPAEQEFAPPLPPPVPGPPPAPVPSPEHAPREESGWDAEPAASTFDDSAFEAPPSMPTELDLVDAIDEPTRPGPPETAFGADPAFRDFPDDVEPVTTRPHGDSEFASLLATPTPVPSPDPPPVEPTPVPPPPAATQQRTVQDRPSRPRAHQPASRSIPPPPFATPSMMPPPKEYDDSAPALATYQDFRRETHRLARTRDYRSIATLHESALVAPWAHSDDVHINLLLDLAKLYRDRLTDRPRAQEAFERLIQRRPGHNEAMEFLKEEYETQGNMRKLHDLYASAVDEEWSPERRVELTRAAARIALDHLDEPATAAHDWERLLELGDMDGQVTVELSQVYREAERWPDLGEFLENRAAACAGTTRVAVLREAIEAFLSGARSPERAESLITQVLEESADDPIALASLAIVRAQQSRWADLEQIAERPMDDVAAHARLDVLRLTAELLTSAGEHDRAATAYERILSAAPNDRDAVNAREQHLRRKGDHQGLVQFLIKRANKARTADEKATQYQRAAQVADEALGSPEMSAELWQQSVQAKPDKPEAYEALVALHDRLDNVEGVTQALEGLASVTREPKVRAVVMRRLGDHYAYRADNDDEAQRCWLEVASILPDDLAVQKELNGIHRRRGDFASLDEALTRQLWRTTDLDAAVELAREVARNLNENLSAPAKNVRAWLHVLDLAPDADDALGVLTDKLGQRAETTEVQDILETRLSKAIQQPDVEERIGIGLQIARNWEERGDRLAALAAYERVRAWAPCDDRVLEPLVRLHAADNPTAAASTLELASAHADSEEVSRNVLERMMPLVPEGQPRQRFFLLHRLLRFDASSGLGEVVEAATTAEAWKELAALYERLAENNVAPEMRRTFRLHLARVCEENLGNPHRAFVALQSLALTAASDDDRMALTRLAETTGRWEDLLAVLDATLMQETTHDVRQSVLRQRAEICEQRLEDPRRSFLELQRLVEGRASGELDEAESQALEHMHRIAVEHGLVRELEAIYGELWDRAPDDDVRVLVARARQAIRRDHLDDPAGALDQALLVLRLRPDDEAVANEVIEAAEALNLWTRTLPVLEGVWRAKGDRADKLLTLAQLYRDKCEQSGHAAELLSEALRLQPGEDSTVEMLDALGDTTGLWPSIVIATRLGAARCSGTPRGLQLAQKVAALYADKLGDIDASLDTHRWILQVWPDEVGSLETLINAHREAQEHIDLRGRLEQWVERVADTDRHVERWLEIGRLCRDHLDDAAGALVAFSNVIELDPSNDEAADAMRALGDVSLPIALRRKKVKVELTRATAQRRLELLESLAGLEQEMGETDAAIAALRELFDAEGGRDMALAPLASMLRESERWEELAALDEQAAENAEPENALEHLHAALRVTEEHLDDTGRLERLLRRIITLDPTENDAFVRLARLLRNAGRYEELATEQAARLDAHADGYEPNERLSMRRELVRITYLAQGDVEKTEALLREHPDKPAKPDPDDAAWLAMIMAAREDHAKYLEQRRRHLVKLPKRLGALVVCHLAEYCDLHMKMKGRVLALYREARTIDPQNTLASDALRGLGRGVKTWRSTSALLTEPGEESLTDVQRADRLFQLGEEHRANEPMQAIGWLERAVAVNPNHVAAWDALTAIGLERHDFEYAQSTSLEAVLAYERTTPPGSQEEIAQHAQRLAKSASIARMAELDEEARALSTVAYAMDPNVASAAILVADTRFESGATEQAGIMYADIVEQLGEDLEPKQRAHALHRRAKAALEAGDIDTAHDGLREALAAVALFPPALDTMAEVLRRQGHPVNAALHELKALLVTRDTAKRGPICRRLGELCDGELKRPGEAGAWFELAVEAGVEDKVLMRRLLEHFRRTGRAQQALVTIGELIETTIDPLELAELWATRGAILADHDLNAAEEALDIALSFNPAHPTALASLCTVLENRGDYEQLAALLDARSDTGTVEERADALRTLAQMSFEKLDDPERAEEYLQRLVELAPTAEALEQLLAIVKSDPSRQGELLPLLSRLMAAGGPVCDRIVEAAQLIYETGQRHWTWAMLSAMMGAAPIDTWTKSTLGELRREFERFDSLKLLHPFVLDTLGVLPEPEPFQAALGDLCARVFLRSDEGAGSVVDGRTGPGKVFERVAEQLSLQAKLVRSPDGSPPASVLSGDVLTVVVRTDLLAASPGELAFIYTRGLMLARPECVALASVPEEDQPRIVRAICAAVDANDEPIEDPETAALSSAFAGKLAQEELAVWKDYLEDVEQAEAMAAAAFAEIEEAAMRVAAVAAGDARTAVRAMARLTADGRRPPGVARVEEFEAYYQAMPILGRLFAFIATEDFGRILAASA
jgi:tetratricopeptide (TPR) repeat protein